MTKINSFQKVSSVKVGLTNLSDLKLMFVFCRIFLDFFLLNILNSVSLSQHSRENSSLEKFLSTVVEYFYRFSLLFSLAECLPLTCQQVPTAPPNCVSAVDELPWF